MPGLSILKSKEPEPAPEPEPMAGPSFVCLLNCKAGSCDPTATTRLIEEIAAELGLRVHVLAPEADTDLTALAREAVDAGATVVAAGGGDGTINAVASALVGSDVALGVLPLGTLNHFAKDLGIPLNVEAAIRTIFSGSPIAVDVGAVNDRICLNNCSLGLYPRIVRQREAHQSRGLPKWIAFIRALFYAARTHTSVYLRLKIDNERSEIRKTPFVFIGNNRYELAGLQIGKRASLTGGHLWICKAPDVGRAGLLRLTLRALTGRLKGRDLEATEAREAWIETRSPHTSISTDGEVQRIQSPLHYRSLPQALKVLVPRNPPPVV